MARKSNTISTPKQGSVSDYNLLDTPKNSFTYCLNGTVESKSQDGNVRMIQNDGSNILAVNFPEGFIVIGRRRINEQNRVIYALVNPQTGASQIGEVLDCEYDDDKDDEKGFVVGCEDCLFPIERVREPLENIVQQPYCNYHVIISASCLNFNINYPVKIRYKIADCSLNIYFTDKLNERRFLYFDYNADNTLRIQNRFKVITGFDNGNCDQPIYSEELDCNKILYHPKYETPCFDLIDVTEGGSLKAGAYQFFAAYSDVSANVLTDYIPATQAIPIFTKEITFETNYTTDKSILLQLNNLDLTNIFSYYTVVVAETIDSFTEFKKVGTFPVSQNRIRYTGREITTKLTPEDVFFKRVYYRLAGNIANANDFLFFSDLEEFDIPNLQRVANEVKLYWQTASIPEAVYRDPQSTFRFKSNDRDEVYPYGMVFEMDNGKEYGPYHIPGLSKEYLLDNYSIDVDRPVSNDDVIENRSCIDNCCGESNRTTEISGTIHVSCSDGGCSHQGSVSLDFTFPAPLENPLTLYIGKIIMQTANGNALVASGFDLFDLPPGVAPHIYYTNPNRPFKVVIPAGVSSYNVPEFIYLTEGIPFVSTWVCHDCLFPITDLYIKPISSTDNLSLNFTSDQSITIHNIDNIVNVGNEEGCVDCTTNKTWQVYNTGFVVAAPKGIIDKCDKEKVWEWGEFSYWESTRTYPNLPEIWGDLCGKPIRHHKYPDSSVTHIHDGLEGNKGFTDGNMVRPIGILVDHSSVIQALDSAVASGIISQEDRSRIVRYRIIRGNRVGNESIVAKGLLFDMWNYNKSNNTNTYYYANYPYNDLRSDYFISPTDDTYDSSNTSDPIPTSFSPSRRYTFHSPDIHFKNPTIGTELKLETLEYGQAEGFFNKCEEQAKYAFLSTAATLLALAAGVAAAFSSEKEKECKVVVTKSMQNVSGTVPGAIITLPGVPYVNYAPIVTLDPLGPMLYSQVTGQPDPTRIQPFATEVHRHTCKGSTFQLLDPLSFNPAGIFLQQFIYLGIIAMREMKIIEDLIRALVPDKNFAIQYNSVGKYVNYQNVANAGNKIRSITRSAYLDPSIQLINEAIDTNTNTFSNVYVNNWNRERSVYLKTDPTKSMFPNPSVQDQSRFTLDNIGFEQEDLLRRTRSQISSYYGSIKRYVPDQYGEISDIEYVEIENCTLKLNRQYTVDERAIFGGDKFITRFALKRKMPFFIQTRFKFGNHSDVEYSELGNVGYPNYYFDTEQPLMERIGNSSFSITNLFNGALLQDLLGVARSRLDARKPKFFYQSGFIHLYNYGIPYFLVESDVNTDYRYGQNNLEKDFFPHQQDLEFWLQEKNVPITEDNYYFYNNTYSKQNKESFIGTETPDVDLRPCKVTHPSRVINSMQDQIDKKTDNWLVFRPNDFFDFPLSNGRVIGLDGIESDKVIVRFENTMKIFNAYDVLSTDFKEIQIGNAGLFASRPKEYYSTALGYGGAQHSDLLLTEFGHIWADAKRGQIFNLAPGGGSLKDITQEEVSNWFKENLPFQIRKDFPEIEQRDIDNNFKGIGLHLSFDKRFTRVFITKLDYKRLNNNITYNPDDKEFHLNGEVVSVRNKKYFCNKSWTVSYNLKTHDWIYHSFIPNFYVDNVEYIQTGFNYSDKNDFEAKLWSHNVTNKSYQVYCGKLYPFMVEIPSEPMIENGILNSVLYDSEAIRYHNKYDYVYDRTVTFNKGIVYNERQCSGEVDLIVRDENNLHDMVAYPKVFNNRQKILITNLNNQWMFNQFWDVVNTQKGNIPFFVNKCNNAEKVLNLDALNYYKSDFSKQPIRGKQTKVRLIQDARSEFKLLLRFLIHDRTKNEF